MLQHCCTIVLPTGNRTNSLKKPELFPNFTHPLDAVMKHNAPYAFNRS